MRLLAQAIQVDAGDADGLADLPAELGFAR